MKQVSTISKPDIFRSPSICTLVIFLLCSHSMLPRDLSAQSQGQTQSQTRNPSLTLFQKGLEALHWQRYAEAVSFLRQASESEPGNDEYFLYLGLGYRSMGRLEESRTALDRGIELQGPKRNELLLSRGNLLAATGDSDGAASDYTWLIKYGGSFSAPATLNRANLELELENYSEALSDYEYYLDIAPRSSQRQSIEKIIALLRKQIDYEQEQERLAEQARIRAEEERLAEEARRKALLESVLDSLSGSGDDTVTIGAGSESIDSEFPESELED